MAEVLSGDGCGGEGYHFVPNTHKHSLIFLHGLGDTGAGWKSLIWTFRKSRGSAGLFANTKFILPTAPIRPITLNGGMPMPAWADICSLDGGKTEDETGYMSSVKRIQNIIDKEINTNNIPPENIVVGGFSQGGAVAYLSALFYPKRLGGIVACSSWLPLAMLRPELFKNLADSEAKNTPVLHCHGTGDDMVKYKWGVATVQQLKDRGINVEMKSYNGMGHTASEEELDDVLDFVKSLWSSNSSTNPTPTTSTGSDTAAADTPLS